MTMPVYLSKHVYRQKEDEKLVVKGNNNFVLYTVLNTLLQLNFLHASLRLCKTKTQDRWIDNNIQDRVSSNKIYGGRPPDRYNRISWGGCYRR